MPSAAFAAVSAWSEAACAQFAPAPMRCAHPSAFSQPRRFASAAFKRALLLLQRFQSVQCGLRVRDALFGSSLVQSVRLFSFAVKPCAQFFQRSFGVRFTVSARGRLFSQRFYGFLTKHISWTHRQMGVRGRTAYRTFLPFVQIFGVSRRTRQSQGFFGMLTSVSASDRACRAAWYADLAVSICSASCSAVCACWSTAFACVRASSNCPRAPSFPAISSSCDAVAFASGNASRSCCALVCAASHASTF